VMLWFRGKLWDSAGMLWFHSNLWDASMTSTLVMLWFHSNLWDAIMIVVVMLLNLWHLVCGNEHFWLKVRPLWVHHKPKM
jgi:hypothetical protein